MSVFDKETKVHLNVPDPGTDRMLPSARSLRFTAISATEALEGTRGEHCQKVHGDQQQEFRGCSTERIRKHVTTTIDGHQDADVGHAQTIRVSGNHKEILAQNCNQTVLGPQIVLNGTVRNETRLGPYNEVYGKLEWHDNHDNQLAYGDNHDERYNESFASHLEDRQYLGFQVGFVGAQAQVVGASVALLGADTSFVTAHSELNCLHMEEHVRHMEFHGGPKPTLIPPGEPPDFCTSHQPPASAISHV